MKSATQRGLTAIFEVASAHHDTASKIRVRLIVLPTVLPEWEISVRGARPFRDVACHVLALRPRRVCVERPDRRRVFKPIALYVAGVALRGRPVFAPRVPGGGPLAAVSGPRPLGFGGQPFLCPAGFGRQTQVHARPSGIGLRVVERNHGCGMVGRHRLGIVGLTPRPAHFVAEPEIVTVGYLVHVDKETFHIHCFRDGCLVYDCLARGDEDHIRRGQDRCEIALKRVAATDQRRRVPGGRVRLGAFPAGLRIFEYRPRSIRLLCRGGGWRLGARNQALQPLKLLVEPIGLERHPCSFDFSLRRRRGRAPVHFEFADSNGRGGHDKRDGERARQLAENTRTGLSPLRFCSRGVRTRQSLGTGGTQRLPQLCGALIPVFGLRFDAFAHDGVQRHRHLARQLRGRLGNARGHIAREDLVEHYAHAVDVRPGVNG